MAGYNVNAMHTAGALWAEHGIPEVVLSFGAADSAYLAQWLQIEITKRMNWPDDSVKCYLDTKAMLLLPGTNPSIMQFGPQENFFTKLMRFALSHKGTGGEAQMQDFVPTSGGCFPQLNVNWKSYYGMAVDVCQTMVFLVTPKWLESKNCLVELGQFIAAAKYRAGTKNTLRGVVVSFPEMGGVQNWAQFKIVAGEQGAGAILDNVEYLLLNRQSAITPDMIARAKAATEAKGQTFHASGVNPANQVATLDTTAMDALMRALYK